MAQPTAVILVVGLNQSLLRHAPRLRAFAEEHAVRPLRPVLPAVTCSVQSSMLTGLPPGAASGGHGIVGNGWYDRTLAEVQFWKQSNHLVHGEKVWETARRRDASVSCANLFWWFNMYSSVDYSVTPRPMYKADGRKIPDIYTQPAGLREELKATLGPFPLFNFWGPRSSIASSRWIAGATMRVHAKYRPTLTLSYLPHLDYDLQRFGPQHASIPAAVGEVDQVAGGLIDYFRGQGVRVMIVSEYSIEAVDEAVFVNRALREAKLLRVREEDGHELLDAGGSDAFAVVDHQVAHVYVRKREDIARVAALCGALPGVARALTGAGVAAAGLDHARAGDIVLVAQPRRWFTYDYWPPANDDSKAPDFARTVDIHRKPGYDPRELFIDPTLRAPRLRIALKILRRKLGSRTLLDVIPLDTRLVRGSHGRLPEPNDDPSSQPVLICDPARLSAGDAAPANSALPCTAVRDVILRHLFG